MVSPHILLEVIDDIITEIWTDKMISRVRFASLSPTASTTAPHRDKANFENFPTLCVTSYIYTFSFEGVGSVGCNSSRWSDRSAW